jgi:hypothetical protein
MPLLAGAALRNLRRWAVDGVAPPRADRLTNLASKEDGPAGGRGEALPLVRDEHRNALGGVRTPDLDVPVATYYPHSTLPAEGGGRSGFQGGLMGSMTRFSDEKLRSLYGSVAQYRKEYAAGVDRLVAEGWINEAEAEGWINEAEAEDWRRRAGRISF